MLRNARHIKSYLALQETVRSKDMFENILRSRRCDWISGRLKLLQQPTSKSYTLASKALSGSSSIKICNKNFQRCVSILLLTRRTVWSLAVCLKRANNRQLLQNRQPYSQKYTQTTLQNTSVRTWVSSSTRFIFREIIRIVWKKFHWICA